MTDSAEVLVVLTTFPDESSAARCAEQLVQEGIVACAQVTETPVRSFYQWGGEMRCERESVVVLKTSARRWPELQARLTDLHPYDVPELIAIDARASQAYGAWLHRGCSGAAVEDHE
jgi:periplasmic divalent cation tolerance protein